MPVFATDLDAVSVGDPDFSPPAPKPRRTRTRKVTLKPAGDAAPVVVVESVVETADAEAVPTAAAEVPPSLVERLAVSPDLEVSTTDGVIPDVQPVIDLPAGADQPANANLQNAIDVPDAIDLIDDAMLVGDPGSEDPISGGRADDDPISGGRADDDPVDDGRGSEARAGEARAGEARAGEAPPSEGPIDDSGAIDAGELFESPIPPDRGHLSAAPASAATSGRTVLSISGLTKRFGGTLAVDGISLDVRAGSFFGIVGPNGAGKTTTLSMVTGLLRPDAGTVTVHGIDVWREPERAKRAIGVLPDALRLFDRLTGGQLLHYSGVLRGLDAASVRQRSADLVAAFGLEDATGRLVADYSAGMTKKIALAAAMIHSPRLLVLDEPFESVDPVSAANIVEILQRYVASGGTVVLSSHGMDLIQRVCDHVAIVIGGRVLAAGTTDEVRGEQSLEERFVELAGGRKAAEGLEWLHSFSD